MGLRSLRLPPPRPPPPPTALWEITKTKQNQRQDDGGTSEGPGDHGEAQLLSL